MPGNFIKDETSSHLQAAHQLAGSKKHDSGTKTEYPVTLPMSDDDFVISGVSGRYPEADNINEFRDNLMNYKDVISEDNRRWTPGQFKTPRRAGKLKELKKFDATFFGIHAKQANRMDPQSRMLLETAYEAIVDAGVDPEEIRGSNTGVFIGTSGSESMAAWSLDPHNTTGLVATGCLGCFFPNRISYFFDLKGPSYAVDTACSSSFVALDQAMLSLRTGQCDAAIVSGTQLCVSPALATQFKHLGVLSDEGKCMSFDESGNGYVRSEGVVSIYLQKTKVARRIYARLIHTKQNSDGGKEDDKDISFPCGKTQLKLMKKIYEECGVNPHDVTYVEAHGTGTKAGDPEECNAITDMFCKGRETPLLIGSVKSHLGHGEPSSGLHAISKVIVASEAKMLPANLHFQNPNTGVPALHDGRLKVVTENTPWNGGLCAVNNFGIGGSNVHAVLDTAIADKVVRPVKTETDLPRLVTYCGRTEDHLRETLNTVKTQYGDNFDLHALLGKSACQSYMRLPYRGFAVVNKSGHDSALDVKKCEKGGRPLWYVFSGMGSQWFGMAKELMQLDVFAQSIKRSAGYLAEFGMDLIEILTSDDSSTFNSTINSFVSIAVVQVALVDMLTALGLSPDGIIGHSVGELGSAYADGCLTAEETVLAAYWRGRCVTDAGLEPGVMAAVGLSWEDAQAKCPEGVVAACHNSKDSVTISGDAQAVSRFVKQLKREGIFAKEVSTNGVAFHSHHMTSVAPALRAKLSQVIKPKRRGARWISTSVTEESNEDLHLYSSADYHVNNLISPVRFHNALGNIPKDAVVIEIAPHALLQSVLKRALGTECLNVGLQKRGHENNLEFFYQSVGRLYQAGYSTNVNALYKDVFFPVARGTPSLSSLVKWDHSVDYEAPEGVEFCSQASKEIQFEISTVDSPDNEWSFLLGHKMDSRVILPSAGYVILAWRALAETMEINFNELPVMFENIEILAPTFLEKEGSCTLSVSILPATGSFEVISDGKIKASGKVIAGEKGQEVLLPVPQKPEKLQEPNMTSEDFYYELRVRGYEYEREFKGVDSAITTGGNGMLRWYNNWISFLDTAIHFGALSLPRKTIFFPQRAAMLRIDPFKQRESFVENEGPTPLVPINLDLDMNIIQAGGIQIIDLELAIAPRNVKQRAPILESYEFTPYERVIHNEMADYMQCCAYAASNALQSLSNTDNLAISPGLLNQLLKIRGSDCPDASLLNSFSDSKVYPLLDYLRNLTGYTKQSDGPTPIMKNDKLLNSIFSLKYLKPAMDLLYEDCLNTDVEFTEVIDSQMTSWYSHVNASYDTLPKVVPQVTAWLSPSTNKENHSHDRVTFKQAKLDSNEAFTSKQNGIMFTQVLEVPQAVDIAKKVLMEDGFLFTVDYTTDYQSVTDMLSPDFELIYKVEAPFQTLSMWRLRSDLSSTENEMLDASGYGTDWVEPLKEKLASLGPYGNGKRLWVVSNDRNGTIGLAKSLREEPSGEKIRCIFNAGSEQLPAFDSEECLKQRRKDVSMNAYLNGTWGSYRYVPLEFEDTAPSKYAEINIHPPGSALSNLKWIESPVQYCKSDENGELCRVAYSSLNFRDVMLTTGKLQPEAIPFYEKMQGFMLGMEFSGYSEKDNRRVMGMCQARALATVTQTDPKYLMDVPEDWSMKDAATVPVVYTTVYYALIDRGHLSANETVLIHSGLGGVGSAAINVALSLGCEVFTSVGSEARKRLLMEIFPQLKADHILDSHSTDFELEIKRLTRGKGIDVILNSLAEEKLQASVRLLAKHGRFLEIGKVDMANNTPLGMGTFIKDVSFHGILLDSLMDDDKTFRRVIQMVKDGIQSGVVKPLRHTCFSEKEVEKAFRYMATGKHHGKVIIEVNPEAENNLKQVQALRSFFCNPEKSYVIVGGLGGFGLEMARWLATRGCKKLVLTSRSGVTKGYQRKALEMMRNDGVDVRVSKKNAVQYTGAKELIEECLAMGPLGGLFNLAMVLRDGLMENQTEVMFKTVLTPKIQGTLNLDSVTRELCANTLDHFVAFSSIWGGHGGAGLANYACGNSAMEKICEDRKNAGFPALAIQWGGVADVGILINNSVDDNDVAIGGSLPQRLLSCLSILDVFLCISTHAVLSSFVIADKKQSAEMSTESSLTAGIFSMLGITDLSSVSQDSTLGSLGLDSLTAAEVKQVLQKKYNLQYSMKEIRGLTQKVLNEAEAAF